MVRTVDRPALLKRSKMIFVLYDTIETLLGASRSIFSGVNGFEDATQRRLGFRTARQRAAKLIRFSAEPYQSAHCLHFAICY
jgi:hypothetical protein